MNLGQFFSKQQKLEVLQNQFNCGRIFYLYSKFTRPRPKEKYLLLVCVSPKILFLVINSEIHPFIKNNSELLQCQILLESTKTNSLLHDSYIDCTNVIESLTLQNIIDQVEDDPGRIKGMVDEGTKLKIVEAVAKSKTLTNLHKVLIKKSLSTTTN